MDSEHNSIAIPPAVQPLLAALTARYAAVLGDNLVGLYLHGSLAFGCFTWAKSDIDFIAVVRTPLAQDTRLALLAVLEELRQQAPPKGFEMSVVLATHCRDFVYPTPFQLHFSNHWLTRYLADPLSLCGTGGTEQLDHDLAAHFTVIHHAGIVLTGSPIAAVFGAVPPCAYRDSIVRDICDAVQDVRNNPVYIILNLCRVLAYHRENRVLSKEQGGLWGVQHLPAPYTDLIAAALRDYRGEQRFADHAVTQEEQADFCRHMLAELDIAAR